MDKLTIIEEPVIVKIDSNKFQIKFTSRVYTEGTGGASALADLTDVDLANAVDGENIIVKNGDEFTVQPATPIVTDWSDVQNKPTEFTPESHTQGWDTITDKPASYPADPASLPAQPTWETLEDKPVTYEPSAHQHAGSDVTSAVADATHATNADSAGHATTADTATSATTASSATHATSADSATNATNADNADTLDTKHATDFATATHTHTASGFPYKKYDPDCPPNSPNSKNKEFINLGINLDDWSVVDNGNSIAQSNDGFGLKVTSSTVGGVKFAGFLTSLPDSDTFAICMKSAINSKVSTAIGLCLTNGTLATSNIYAGLTYSSSSMAAINKAGIWSDNLLGSTSVGNVGLVFGASFYQILYYKKSTSEINSFVSLDGINWKKVNTDATLSFTPTKVGICMYQLTGDRDVDYARVSWVRFIENVPWGVAYFSGSGKVIG